MSRVGPGLLRMRTAGAWQRTEQTLRFAEEADSGLEDAVLEGRGGLGFDFLVHVVQVRPAEAASQQLGVEADVPLPLGVEGAEKVPAEGGSLRAGEALGFPDLRERAGQGLGGIPE